MAYILNTDGSMVGLIGENDDKPSLKQLQDAVGGYIEIHPTNDQKLMVINEEGKLMGLKVNPIATDMVSNTVRDVIVGNVVICEQGEIE